MDFYTWSIDLKNNKAHHSCGFELTVEGDPRQPVGVIPGRFPKHLNAVEQARLLRCGMQAIIKAANNEAQKEKAQ